ncbi:MAG: hypothetical protein EAX95_05635 [Candidatus Thorarchaeota archaeon]|nr:hypothetical protein [Candidatus Thorarchaeota archaeon]
MQREFKLAHEALAIALACLGALLLISFNLGPKKEVREVKRLEAKAMLVPSAILLFVLAALVFSGVVG